MSTVYRSLALLICALVALQAAAHAWASAGLVNFLAAGGARYGPVTLAAGTTFTGYTLNGSTPGPTIRAREGQVVEVTLRNVDVPAGVTLHWHGYDVPGGMDGVAGASGRRAGRGVVHLPLPRRPGGHLLVPLPPGLARAGHGGPVRRARGGRSTGAWSRTCRCTW